MTDCYFEKKDWRQCKDEVRLYVCWCLNQWFEGTRHHLLIVLYRWRHFDGVGRLTATTSGPRQKMQTRKRSHRQDLHANKPTIRLLRREMKAIIDQQIFSSLLNSQSIIPLGAGVRARKTRPVLHLCCFWWGMWGGGLQYACTGIDDAQDPGSGRARHLKSTLPP